MDIRIDDLSGAAIRGLLAEHLEEMRGLSPRESVHALDLDQLRHPSITLWSAWSGPSLLGCGALKEFTGATGRAEGEIKSMRTRRDRRRTGVGRQILDHLIAVARERSYERLSLETGSMEAFEPARRLYQRYGFVACEPFGSYRPDPNSVFMTRSLTTD